MKIKDTPIYLFDIPLFSRDENQLLNILHEKLLRSESLVTVATPNPEQSIQLDHDPAFRATFSTFDVCVPDGVGLVWASRVLAWGSSRKWGGGIVRPALAGRITGTDLARSLLDFSREHKLSVLVIGGREYDLGQTDTPTSSHTEPVNLASLYPDKNLPECWWLSGYADVRNKTSAEEFHIKAVLREYRPAIVFVALGAPHQELWVAEHRELLEKTGVRVALVVGGAFDYLLGRVPRAPHFLRSIGLEWACRLVRQPWRFKRQLRLVEFVWKVLVQLFTDITSVHPKKP